MTISVPVNQNGWQSDDGSVTHSKELEAQCKTEPDLCGGHTVILTGYDQKREVFFFKNSWGGDWGKQGYGIMPYDFVKNWSYGSFFYLDVKKFDANVQNNGNAFQLSPVQSSTELSQDSEGRPVYKVSLKFRFDAPLGTFYYVSLFPQLEIKPSSEGETSDYEVLYIKDENGKAKALSDRRFILAFQAELLDYSTGGLELSIPQSELEKAGLENLDNLVLRPTIYQMTDTESYKVLFREYLNLPR